MGSGRKGNVKHESVQLSIQCAPDTPNGRTPRILLGRIDGVRLEILERILWEGR